MCDVGADLGILVVDIEPTSNMVRKVKDKEITFDDFERAIKEVLLKPVPSKAKYQNKKPTQKELNTEWK